MVSIERATLTLKVGEDVLDVTRLVGEWQDWEITHKRDSLGVSSRTTSFPFTFHGAAMDVLEREFNRYFQNAKAKLLIEAVDNSFTETYDLDFSTYEKTDEHISISVRNVDLRTLIKQNGNTEYDISVDLVKEPISVQYERLPMDNRLTMVQGCWQDINVKALSNEITVEQYSDYLFFTSLGAILPFTLDDTDIPVKDYLNYRDTAFIPTHLFNKDNGYKKEDGCQFSVIRGASYNVKYSVSAGRVSFVFVFSTEKLRDDAYTRLQQATNRLTFYLKKLNGFDDEQTIRSISVPLSLKTFTTSVTCLPQDVPTQGAQLYASYCIELYWECASPRIIFNYNGFLSQGDYSLQMLMNTTANISEAFWPHFYVEDSGAVIILSGGLNLQTANIVLVGSLNVTYKAAALQARSLPCAKVTSLLQALFTKMGSETNVNVSYDTDPATLSLFETLVFVASDTINGNTAEPKFSLKFNQLSGFIRMLGYDLALDSGNVIITRLSNAYGYNGNNSNIELSEEEVADLQVTPNTDMVYSEIEIGYTKAISEGLGSEREFNKTLTFVTNANSQNKLDLTTEIRADGIGLERALCDAENKGDSASTSNRKDVFVIRVQNTAASYVPYIEQALGADTTLGMYSYINADLNPRRILEMSWTFALFSFTDNLAVSAADGVVSRNVLSENLTDNILPDSPLAQAPSILPVTYDLATSDDKALVTRKDLNGWLSFSYNGKTYKAFITEVSENPLLRVQNEYKLLASAHGITVDDLRPPKHITTTTVSVASIGDNMWVEANIFGYQRLSLDDFTYSLNGNTWFHVRRIIVNANRLRISLYVTPNETTSIRNGILSIIVSPHEVHDVVFIEQSAKGSDVFSVHPSSLEFSANDALNNLSATVASVNTSISGLQYNLINTVYSRELLVNAVATLMGSTAQKVKFTARFYILPYCIFSSEEQDNSMLFNFYVRTNRGFTNRMQFNLGDSTKYLELTAN